MKLKPIKWYTSLQKKKYRKKECCFLVEGERALSQIYATHKEMVKEILLCEEAPGEYDPTLIRRITEKQMSQILSTETIVPVVAVVDSSAIVREQINLKTCSRVLFLEDVQDPGNVGTLIRSAVAFGFSTILLSKSCADPLSPKVVRSTGGAIAEVSIVKSTEPYSEIAFLKESGFTVVTADLNGTNVIPNECPNIIFALGNEGNGVTDRLRALSDVLYTIPYASSKIESLNVAVAGSIGMAGFYTGD